MSKQNTLLTKWLRRAAPDDDEEEVQEVVQDAGANEYAQSDAGSGICTEDVSWEYDKEHLAGNLDYALNDASGWFRFYDEAAERWAWSDMHTGRVTHTPPNYFWTLHQKGSKGPSVCSATQTSPQKGRVNNGVG